MPLLQLDLPMPDAAQQHALQLGQPDPVLVKYKDAWVEAMAHVVIDYGFGHDLYWVVFADESRECWTAANRNIRA
jgi:hypothetical protein